MDVENSPTLHSTSRPASEVEKPNASLVGRSERVTDTALVAKLDRHIIPMVVLLYLLSFLDRVNIGNARLYGLESDLGMTGNMFQTSVSLLFVTYLLFEVPSNLALKKLRPSRYIPFITIAWGTTALCTGFVHSYGGLIACRLLLGTFEAGLFPGMTVYLTFFYTRRELALRISYLFVSSALAGACGGLLAYGIGHLDGHRGMRGWRWIMILEGVPTVLAGVAAIFVLADDPESATYLTPSEKEYLCAKKLQEQGETRNAQQFHWNDVAACFKDWKSYAFAIGQFGVDTMLYGYSTFLPTIISKLGSRPSPVVQAMTIPCYALGALTYITIARWSDKTQLRGVYCVIFGLVSVVGYAILLSPVSNGVRYFGCFVVACGLYVAVGIPLSWLPNNFPRYGKRAAGSGFQLTLGNASGIMSSFIYPTTDSPRFIRGHAVSLAMVAMGTLIYSGLWWWYARENRRRASGYGHEKVQGMTDDQIMELGDESPNFKFVA